MKTLFSALAITLSFAAFSQINDSTKGKLQIVAEPGIQELQQHYTDQNKKDNSIAGYRVQIYNGNKAETLKKRAEFLSKFPKVPIYTLYEAPEYKAQAGDFRTRLEAEKFLALVQQELGSAFVVNTKIKPPKIEVPSEKK